MPSPENRFFKRLGKVSSVANNAKLIEALIAEITFLKCAFEDELERTIFEYDKKDLRGAIERSGIRLDTLHKMKDNQPVESANLNLLVQYGNNKEHPEITDYPNILDTSSPTP